MKAQSEPDLSLLATAAEHAVAAAGRAIMRWHRRDDQGTEMKGDQSPVTQADLDAHEIIAAGLEAACAEIPILSEEGHHASAEVRRGWERCWLVDPLDGTREFIAGNDDFTVNVALIDGGRPVLGVVGVPARNEVYVGIVPWGRAERVEVGSGHRQSIRTRVPGAAPVILASRSHRTAELETLVEGLRLRFPDLVERQVGSALKLVELAAGRADGYPRRGPCAEWDIAAGDAVLEAAGGLLRTFGGEPLRYNKPDSLLNPDFWAVGDPAGELAEALRALR